MRTICLVRHGETLKNKEMRLQGRCDDPLNENGSAQAKKARDFLKSEGFSFAGVFASPLQRAYKTAEILTEGKLPILSDERLLEMDYGPYEGMSMRQATPELLYFFEDFVHHPAPEGMESLEHVKKRLGSFLEFLKEETEGDILVCTHAIALKGALECLTPDSHGSYWSKYIGNCAVYRTWLTDGEFTVPEEIFSL